MSGRRSRQWIAPLALALAGLGLPWPAAAPPARACDACLEDKIAATYDWQVVTATRRRGHTIVFSAIRGPVRPGDTALSGRIARTVGAVPGVDAGTVRVSLTPPAVSFACDPVGRAPASRVAAINRRLRPSGLALVIVRVGAPGLGSPSAAFQ